MHDGNPEDEPTQDLPKTGISFLSQISAFGYVDTAKKFPQESAHHISRPKMEQP
jgi:hypothetical protein